MIIVDVSGKDFRPCSDYRKLNAIMRYQTYPIPNIEERVEKVSGANFRLRLRSRSRVLSGSLSERVQRYAAFGRPQGTFAPLLLSFGLKNSPFCFSNLMDRVLRGLDKFALPYLDDVAIFFESWADHVESLRIVLSRLKEAGLKVKPEMCQLGRVEVDYLGHIVGRGSSAFGGLGISGFFNQDRDKIISWSRGTLPALQPAVFRDCQPSDRCAKKTEPEKVNWGETKEHALKTLKEALMRQPVLRASDYKRPFVVQCDASNRGMEVVLAKPTTTKGSTPFFTRVVS